MEIRANSCTQRFITCSHLSQERSKPAFLLLSGNKNTALGFVLNQIKAQKDLRKCGGYKLVLEQKRTH